MNDYDMQKRAGEVARARYAGRPEVAAEVERAFHPALMSLRLRGRILLARNGIGGLLTNGVLSPQTRVELEVARVVDEIAARMLGANSSGSADAGSERDRQHIGPAGEAEGREPVVRPVRARRRDLLAPLVEAAQRQCTDPWDAPAVFAVLRGWAREKRAPLIGATEAGLQWLDADDEQRDLSMKSLRGRLRRREEAARQGSTTLDKAQ